VDRPGVARAAGRRGVGRPRSGRGRGRVVVRAEYRDQGSRGQRNRASDHGAHGAGRWSLPVAAAAAQPLRAGARGRGVCPVSDGAGGVPGSLDLHDRSNRGRRGDRLRGVSGVDLPRRPSGGEGCPAGARRDRGRVGGAVDSSPGLCGHTPGRRPVDSLFGGLSGQRGPCCRDQPRPQRGTGPGLRRLLCRDRARRRRFAVAAAEGFHAASKAGDRTGPRRHCPRLRRYGCLHLCSRGSSRFGAARSAGLAGHSGVCPLSLHDQCRVDSGSGARRRRP
jgi:hypothetical protein